jgi:hypothetical protein
MKKFLSLVVVCFMLMVVPLVSVYAQEAEPEIFKFDFSVDADTLYIISQNEVTAGIGMNIASIYDGLVELRVETTVPVNANVDTMAGVGAGLNIKKAIELIGGDWKSETLVPSLGILGLVNLNETASLEAAIYLSVIQIDF